MTTVLLTHPDCVRHEMGEGHPESPQRLRSILSAVESSGLAGRLELREAPEATREQLERIHEREHVDLIYESAPKSGYAYLDPDTSMNPHSLSAALRAAGALVAATDLVMSGSAQRAFCAVRPPATMRRARGRWASASSTTWRSARRMRSRRTASIASRCSTSTCTMATARKTHSTKIRA